MLKQQNGISTLFVLFLAVFTFVVCSGAISLNQKLHWWDKNGTCVTNKETINNKPEDWINWFSGIFIGVTSVYVLYYIYAMFMKK